MFRLEFEFAVFDGCSRVVVVVTEGAKGRVEVGGRGQFWSRQSRGATASTCQSSGLVCLISLEGDLQDTVAQPVAVETGDGHGGLVVIRHGDEAEAFALVGVEVTDHLDIVDCTERPKQLPEHTLV